MTSDIYFGIDFGTTNSSMARYDPEKGEAKIILNAEGEEKTPSLEHRGGCFAPVILGVATVKSPGTTFQTDELFSPSCPSVLR